MARLEIQLDFKRREVHVKGVKESFPIPAGQHPSVPLQSWGKDRLKSQAEQEWWTKDRLKSQAEQE
eukprot:510935-Amphidinium_carterae.1